MNKTMECTIFELVDSNIKIKLIRLKMTLELQSIMLYDKNDNNTELSNALKNNYNQLLKKNIPEAYPYMSYDSYLEYMMNMPRITRQHFIDIQGFALISKNWVREVAKYLKGKKCLEIMSGLGTLSKALKDEGVDIIATDDYSWPWRLQGSEKFWCDIENITAVEAIKKYNPEIVIMSWCPHESHDGCRALQAMRNVNPSAEMLVCGEGRGGCTADDEFFDNIKIINNEFIDKADSMYQSWFGMHDRLMLVK